MTPWGRGLDARGRGCGQLSRGEKLVVDAVCIAGAVR